MPGTMFGCAMCCFSTDNYDGFVTHVVRSHRHDPNFIVYCGYSNCPYTTKTWGAFKTHISRKHRVFEHEVEAVIYDDDGAIEVGDDEDGEHVDPLQHQLTLDEQQQLYMGKY